MICPGNSLLNAVFENAEKYAAKIAVVSGSENVTYRNLIDNIFRASKFLESLGLKKGDRVVLSAQKDIKFVYIYFASQLLGITNVIMDAESNPERIVYIESATQPSYSFGFVSEINKSILFSEINLDSYDSDPVVPQNIVSAEDTAEILFTTGTTGKPKGVCLSYSNIYASAKNINFFIGNNDMDVEILALPICHSFGLGRLRCNLLAGATIVLLGGFANVRSFFNAIETFGATGFGVVPAAWSYIRRIGGKRICKYSSQLHYIEIGSASMPISQKKDMLELFPNTKICMHYGLTEASRSTFQEFHDVSHLSSIGKPVSNEVKIAVYDDSGVEKSLGEVGEICVQGNMVFSRYLKDDDNKSAFWGDYFRTGDLGYIDKDGFIYLVGREKEMINVGGKKVSPLEVEEAICSIGGGECICSSSPDPNGILGEVVKAYILKGSTSLTFEEISSKLSERLEHYKKPVEYEWIDAIPQTSSGKKQRTLLKKC